MKNRYKLIPAVLASMAIMLISQSAQAGQAGSEDKFQELKRYEQLPDVPQYSGQSSFVRGQLYPEQKGTVMVAYTILARENPQMVKSWYQDALKMYRWNLPGSQPFNGVSACKGNNNIRVHVTNAAQPGYATAISISYWSTR